MGRRQMQNLSSRETWFQNDQFTQDDNTERFSCSEKAMVQSLKMMMMVFMQMLVGGQTIELSLEY